MRTFTMTKQIDLHVHSNKSDGTLTPSEVVLRAAQKGLAAIALTDHDCTAGIAEALKTASELNANGTAIRVIPGVEISADYKKRDIHILGLGIDPNNTALEEALLAAQKSRDVRNEKMIKNLQDAGLQITMEDLLFDAKDTIITRAHYARHLTVTGQVASREEAFRLYLDSNTPYYVCREYMPPQTATRLIREAGGVPVLAHPMLYHLSLDEIDELVALLKNNGLMGIETIYSKNSEEDEIFVRSLAEKYSLLMTGGSDFHGANKPDIEIGSGMGNLVIPYEFLEKLEVFFQS